MTLIIPHHKTKQEVIGIIDSGWTGVFAGIAGGLVEIVDQTKAWNGSTMSFAFTGRVGFISIPLTGTVGVDDRNVTVQCELPAMAQQFVGEAKIGASIEKNVQQLLQ